MKTRQADFFRNKDGGAKIWIFGFIVIIVVTAMGMGAVLPHFQAKWRLEDEMRKLLNKFDRYKFNNPYGNVELAMEGDLKKYVDEKNLGDEFDPTITHPQNVCRVEAELRKEGVFECDYTVKIEVFGYHLYDMEMHAKSKIDHVK